MNKKENDQLKKIDQLHQQLDNTISKIGPAKVNPIKISKKKLALFILIPFSIACVISAVTSFLLIDPFHWYTKPRSDLELQQEKQIKQLNQQFSSLNLASSLDSSNTVAELLFEMNNYSKINDIVKKPNEITSITSKKDGKSKLSVFGEEVNIKIIVRTGSLEKAIDVNLLVLVENHTVKRVKSLVEYSDFLNNIIEEVKADGKKRASNLVDGIKTVISKNDGYKAVFTDINFDITNDKEDDEIIANGLKSLNVNFSFTENNKSINSSVKLNVNLQGKTRKEINQYLTGKLENYAVIFGGIYGTKNFIAQTAFASTSNYKELIDEFILFAPKNNFYLTTDDFKEFDNSDSNISTEFVTYGPDLNDKITVDSGKWWKVVTLGFRIFVGNEQDKVMAMEKYNFKIIVMKKDYSQKDFFSYINKLRETILQNIYKYELTIALGSRYGEIRSQLEQEINRLTSKIKKPTNNYNVRIKVSNYASGQIDSNVVTAERLVQNGFYIADITFPFNVSEIPDSPDLGNIRIAIPIREKLFKY